MSKPIRWGILSTANIGRWAVIPAIQDSGNGEVVAVASRELDRARTFAEEAKIPRALGSYQALLQDPEIDAIYNPLPNALHAEWSLRALRAGKHVLCEKPLASAEDCLEMAEVSEREGVRLMEAFMYRFHPRTERVVEMVRAGHIGEVRAIRSAFTFRLTKADNIRLDRELDGGALMDVGCYCVNAARTLLGQEPLEVQAAARWTEGYLDRGPDTAVDDELTGILHFENEVRAHFDCSLTMERCEFYEVAGTQGRLRVDNAFLPGTGNVVIREFRGRGEVIDHSIPGDYQYRLMVEHFADCVLEDREPRYSAREAAANMRTIHALYRSARIGGGRVRVERSE